MKDKKTYTLIELLNLNNPFYYNNETKAVVKNMEISSENNPSNCITLIQLENGKMDRKIKRAAGTDYSKPTAQTWEQRIKEAAASENSLPKAKL